MSQGKSLGESSLSEGDELLVFLDEQGILDTRPSENFSDAKALLLICDVVIQTLTGLWFV